MTSVFTTLDKPLLNRPGTPLPAPERVARGKASAVKKREARFPSEHTPWQLSGAELAILRFLIRGGSQAEARDALCMASQTMSTHITRAREKMGALSTLHAAVMLDRFDRQKPQDLEVVLRIEAGRPSVQLRELEPQA